MRADGSGTAFRDGRSYLRARALKLALHPVLIGASFAINVVSLALPLVLLQVYDRIIPNAAYGTLATLLIGLAGALAIDTVLRVARAALAGWAGAVFEHRLGCEAVRRVLGADRASLRGVSLGRQIDRLAAIDQVRDFYAVQGAMVLVDLPFAAVFVLAIWALAGSLVLVPLGLLAAFMLFAGTTGIVLRRRIAERAIVEDRRNGFLQQLLGGQLDVRAMGAQRLMVRRYERLMEGVADGTYRMTWLGGAAQVLGAVFSQLAMALTTGVGAMLVLDGRLTTGGLAASSLLAGRAIQPLLKAMGIWSQFQSVRHAERRVAEMLDLRAEPRGAVAVPRKSGPIELRGLRFGYEPGREIIAGLDLRLDAGETVGISGANGSGKSTLLKMLAGVLPPEAGDIFLAGRRVTAASRADLARTIGYMPQRAVLFDGTILDNLTLFRPEHTARAVELAARLGIDEYVARLPDGLETQLIGGDDGMLPGGVRQRIAMIRALVDEPPILLFDEANSALDRAGDERLVTVLRELQAKGHTLVIVSHRPSLLALAHRRYALCDGRLMPVAQPFVATGAAA